MAEAGELDEIVKEFLVESFENLDQLDQALVALERTPTDEQLLASIFRAMHSIKGTSGMLGFAQLESVSHASENLLSLLRDKHLVLNKQITDVMLATLDAIRELLAQVEATGQDGVANYATLIAALNGACVLPDKKPEAAPPAEKQPPVLVQPAPAPIEPAETLGEMLLKAGKVTPQQLSLAIKQQQDGDPRHVGEILIEQGVVEPAVLRDTLQTQKNARGTALGVENNIRVDVSMLDKLMNLVGELVSNRNQIAQFAAGQHDDKLSKAAQRLALITGELQEGLMKVRLQPVSNAWHKLPRLARDLAAACGKRVRIDMEGTDTEVDKTILEAIKDPLTHLIRNSIDHGIEAPEVRAAAGKPREGRLFLHAFHRDGQVNIEVSDDGAGINVERVKAKALEQGLVTAQQVARMNNRELVNLIFLPGFSTAEKVTGISGRGVGMDVVKNNIEKIGGTVDLQSRPGQGTTIRVKIPLTLAIIPVVVVASGGARFAIPQLNVLELLQVNGSGKPGESIEVFHGVPVYRLRGKLLPIVDLKRELKLGPSTNAELTSQPVKIAVLQADGHKFGLAVDTIIDQQEIVVKPLGKELLDLAVYGGATVMADGTVVLILSALDVAQRAGVLSENDEMLFANEAPPPEAPAAALERVLIFGIGSGERMAVALNAVVRLEQFNAAAIERVGGHEVVHYRGQIMPLVRLVAPAPDENSLLPVVVFVKDGRHVGLVVDHIVDIVEDPFKVMAGPQVKGASGCVVIHDKVTQVLDVPAVLARVCGKDSAK